jgi:hypothetical protein
MKDEKEVAVRLRGAGTLARFRGEAVYFSNLRFNAGRLPAPRKDRCNCYKIRHRAPN